MRYSGVEGREEALLGPGDVVAGGRSTSDSIRPASPAVLCYCLMERKCPHPCLKQNLTLCILDILRRRNDEEDGLESHDGAEPPSICAITA